jgi:predicted Ser/Thr protein kinase
MLKAGLATQTEGPGAAGEAAGPRFVPPPVGEIARLFPQLEILRLIGQGGMGAVYKARQPALDRFVALKVLPPAAANDPGFAERFNREARALARLNHPNIVAVHDFGKAGTLHYLVMEFVDGANLREVERLGELTPEQALAIVPQICEALQFAHNEGIVHRDIKPENLLLDKRGRVKITDFGIAKMVGAGAGQQNLTGAKDVVGTPHYMAPEQVEKPLSVDHRADIYSLGVVFYEMLTGELPLGKFQPPSKKVQIDVRLDEVVLHALEKEPDRRYQQASQVKTAVETIAARSPGDSPVDRNEPGARAAQIEAARQRLIIPARGLVAAGGLLVLFALGLLVFGIPAVTSEGRDAMGYAAVGFGAAVFVLLATVIFLGANSMIKLRNHSFSIVASIVAAFAGPGALLGLPFGIWACLELIRPEVRAAFAATREREGSAGPTSRETKNQRSPAATALRHGSRVALLLFLLIAGAAAIITLLMPKDYVATATVRLTGPDEVDPYHLQTEAEIIQSQPVLEPVAESLKLGQRWGLEFAGGAALSDDQIVVLMKHRVAVRPIPDTALLEILFYSDSPAEAAEIANKITETYCALPPPVRANIIERAMVPSSPIRPNVPLNIFLGMIIGGVLGIFAGLVTGLFSFWRTRTNQSLSTATPAANAPPAVNCPVTMEKWLALMDTGEYAKSWDAAAPYFQGKISKDEWVGKLETIRRPLGEILSRKAISMEQTVMGSRYEAKYNSSFEGLPAAVETVTYAKQSSGEWQPIGYLIRPVEYQKTTRWWSFMSPLMSPEALEIAAHMTPAEKRQAHLRGALFGIWNVLTWFAPLFILMFAPEPFTHWELALAVWLLGIVFYPVWYKMLWELHGSTEWARAHGIKPGSFRKLSFGRANLLKAGAFLGVVLLVGIGINIITSRQLGILELENSIDVKIARSKTAIKSDYIGKAWFPQGDSIAITSVERTPEKMVVKGRYTLVSHDQASLALYITVPNENAPKGSGEVRPILKGTGDFALVYLPPVPGLPHVSMYADGHPFASLYFGTREEAQEENKAGWITNAAPAPKFSERLVAIIRRESNAPASSLQFRLVLPDNSTAPADWLPSASSRNPFRLSRQVLLDDTAIARAGVDFDPNFGNRMIKVRFTDEGAKQFEAITATNIGHQLAIVFRGRVLSAPVIQSVIPGGECWVSGSMNAAEANEIADCLNRVATPTAGAWNFSPAEERILPFRTQPPWLFGWLDLDSGTVLTSAKIDWESHTGYEWIRTNGLDVVASESAKHFPVLLGFDTIIAPAPTNGWDILTPADVANNWTLLQAEPRQDQFLGALPGQTDTFIFQTREGGKGILQILGFADNPPGVKIRYKLAQTKSSGEGIDSATGLPVGQHNTTIDSTTGLPISAGGSTALDSATGLPLTTAAQDDSKNTVAAAEKWLTLVDRGNYSASWNEASAIFQGGVTEAAWENSMKTFRQPLGDLVSRHLKSAKEMTELPGAPDGQYVLMQFETVFANKKSTIETVTFMLEKDGHWKAAGYYIK